MDEWMIIGGVKTIIGARASQQSELKRLPRSYSENR